MTHLKVEISMEEEEEEEVEKEEEKFRKRERFWDVALACNIFKVGFLLDSLVDPEAGGSILRRTLVRLPYVTYYRVDLHNSHCEEGIFNSEGTLRKLATAAQEQFPRIVISLS
jgi:hypothetical protein